MAKMLFRGMGTEVQRKSSMPGYYSMRDLNEDLNGCSDWPLHFRERCLPNGQVYGHSLAGSAADLCLDYDRDAVKKKILEHDAVFKKQVHELHRLYRIQKDLMDDIRRKELAPSPIGSEASCSSMKSLTGHSSPRSSYFQLQNGCTSKVPEWLDSRPSKVGRRMIDLTLPADKYLDPRESEIFKSESSDQEHKAVVEPSKIGRRMIDLTLPADKYLDPKESEIFKSGSSDQEHKVVVDLNQPINAEDDNVAFNHLAHSSVDNGKMFSKQSTSPQCWSSNGALSNWHTNTNGGGRGWMSHAFSAEVPSSCLTGHNYGDPKHALERKRLGISPHLPAYTPNDHAVSLTNDWTKLYKQPCAPQSRHCASVKQKTISFEAGLWPESYSVNRMSIQSIQYPHADHGMLGERCHRGDAGPGAALGGKLPYNRNHGLIMSSSRGPEGMPTRCDDQNSANVKLSTVMDLNRVTSDEEESKEDYIAVLPWLKADASQKGRATAESTFDLEEKIPLKSSAIHLTDRTELGEHLSNIKLLGIPITRDMHMPNKETSLTGKSAFEVADGSKNMRMLDMNLPCDQVPDPSNSVQEKLLVMGNKELSSKISGMNCQIDLNSCADEGETFVLTAERDTGIKNSVVIDLEAFPPHDIEEEPCEDEKYIQSSHREIEHLPDETIRIAAEHIVAISSAAPHVPKASSDENLKWFASIVLKERHLRDCSTSEGVDYFESMTLKLTQMKDDEHLPQSLFPPEILTLREEDSSAATSVANRRPQRKGRQRRDFQRDILPGLASLSRHEVMEDMQTFGGLMRATGHTWNCGTARHGSARNGSSRPRRKKVTSCPSPPVPSPAFPSPVNLAGWGKARRPRRQRCPAPVGNPPPIQLT
ncbi:hypothetical protein SAY86_001877 [Trapa natans]|uniref:Uncharacterized protein n=1 Tax=Trapa natans TaxID=22666 RepID=A0AAN7LCA9_TRANT|nr:hypothetical protein SAY86_001877 [Trapa natans]